MSLMLIQYYNYTEIDNIIKCNADTKNKNNNGHFL